MDSANLENLLPLKFPNLWYLIESLRSLILVKQYYSQ